MVRIGFQVPPLNLSKTGEYVNSLTIKKIIGWLQIGFIAKVKGDFCLNKDIFAYNIDVLLM